MFSQKLLSGSGEEVKYVKFTDELTEARQDVYHDYGWSKKHPVAQSFRNV